MTARPIRRNAQTPDRNGKIFYTSTTSLSHISKGARLILVGDVDQLPPVGPGTPLKDLIAWGDVPVVTLKHVFRQKEGSAIIENAIRIRDGESCVPDEDGEFSVFYVEDDEEAYQTVLRICKDVEYVNDENKMNIQVLSPMYKGCLLYTSPSPRD